MAPTFLSGPRTSAALYARMDAIAAGSAGLCTVHNDSGLASTARGQRLRYLRIKSTGGGTRQAVLITAGMHAREWAPPDALLQFAEYLIDAYRTHSPLDLPAIRQSAFTTKDGGTDHVDLPAHRISKNEVERIMERLDLYLVPVVNPDGRDYTLAPLVGPAPPPGSFRPRDWRKNNPPANGTNPNPHPARGVNLNGNFPVPASGPSLGTMWKDLQRYYSPAAIGQVNASNDPKDWQFYVGPTAASEKETQFVMWLVENKRIRFSMDVHSPAHVITYSWSMETNGTSSDQTFGNAAWDSTPGPPHRPPAAPRASRRDGTTGTAYREFFPDTGRTQLLSAHVTIGRSMRDAIRNAAGSHPNAVPRSTYNESVPTEGSISEVLKYIQPASGMDWVFSRQFTDPTLAPIYAFAFECGDWEEGGMHPTYGDPSVAGSQFPKVEREVVIGTMELLGFAAAWGKPPPASCYVATAVYRDAFHPEIEFVVQLRERELRHTRVGRRFLTVVERAYERVGPPLARYLASHPRMRGIVRRAAVEPLIRAIRRSERATRGIRSRERRVAALLALLTSTVLAAVVGVTALLMLVVWLLAHA